MSTSESSEIYYFIEIDLENLEVIRVGHDVKEALDKGRQTRAGIHRLFISKGQHNKFVNRCQSDLEHVLDN